MTLSSNLNHISQLIAEAERIHHRQPDEVLLLAVSKQQPIEKIRHLFQLGVTHFGENYLQEALTKITALKDLPIFWHFIGAIQSNKTKEIAHLFHWVHSINTIKIAQKLNDYRPEHMPPLNVCLQIKLIEEQGKSGITPHEAAELALAVNQLPHLKLRGLMAIPPPQRNQQEQYEVFLELNHLMHALNQESGLSMDTLSIGMSDDLVPAIKAGATIVRIGRALFGERQGAVL